MTNEKKYISIDYYCKELCQFEKCIGDACKIYNTPAADVAEVRHGEWNEEMVSYTDRYGNLHFGFMCSECHGVYNKTNYCGGCGSKMDGKSE